MGNSSALDSVPGFAFGFERTEFPLSMPELIVALNIPPEKMLAYYRGDARTVMARAITGQTVQFPASVLQKHVSLDGIQGRFRLVFDDNNKFVRFEPVG